MRTMPSWRPWRELAILGLIVMELCWLVPWYRSLTLATYAVSPLRAFLVLGGVLLLAHAVVRFMNFAYLRVDLRRYVLVGLFIVSFFVGLRLLLYENETMSFFEMLNRPLQAFSSWNVLIPDEFVIAVMVLIACWRGISLAQARIGPTLVKRTFQVGIFMLVGFVFINTLATGETPGFLLYLFVFASLVAMGSARISVLRTLRGGEESPFDRPWFLGMIFASLAVVALAAGVARLTSRENLFYENVFSAVFQVFAFLMAIIISPIIYLMLLILQRYRPSSSEVANRIITVLEGLRATLLEMASRFPFRFDFLDWLPDLRPFILWGVVILIALLILSGISRWWIRERNRLEADRQTLLSRGELLRLLGEALKNRFAQIGEDLIGLARLRYRRRWLAAARIRRIYIELMGLTEELDVHRAEAETPLEFLPALRRLFPGSEMQLDTITQAYLRVRYGELPETQAEVDEVESAWSHVNTKGKEILSSKKKPDQR